MKRILSVFISGLVPALLSAQVVITSNFDMVLHGGTQANPTSLVLTNPNTAAITSSGTGGIVSENEFNQVVWPIDSATGTYIVPFLYIGFQIPLTFGVITSGTGNGKVKFATYHGANWNNSGYEPSDVTNMTDFGKPDYSTDAVDRFWIIDAQGFTSKPRPTITFTYVRSGPSSEIATPNNISESSLIAQRFNGGLGEWYDFYGATNTDVTSPNTGTVNSGIVSSADLHRSWGLFNDSTTLGLPVINGSGAFAVFPSPTKGSFTITGLHVGQIVELYDNLGQRLSHAIAGNGNILLDISGRAAGIYLLNIQSPDGTSVLRKQIVKVD